jgi:hypothetical protein
MSEVNVDNTADATAAAAPAPTDNVINLTDLQNVLIVIDMASNRGAFKGQELEPVGQLYNKIARFVQAALPPQDPTAAAAPTADAAQG